MKKAKILYIITQSEWGGAQRYVFDLACSFREEFEVIVAFGGTGKLKERLGAEHIRNFSLPNLIRKIHPWKDFCGFWEIYRLIRKEKPDIVHTNSSKAEILGNLASALAGVRRIIYTAHGFVFNEPMGRAKKRFYIILERMANNFTDAIICVSAFDRSTALAHRIAPAKKMITIHNGIDTDNMKIFLNKTSSPDNSKFIVTTIANFYPTKGLPYLIEAAAIVSRESANVEFWIIGDGQERPYLEKLIAHYGLKNIILWGFQNDASSYLEKSDLFILPSVKEGFPYAIIEAMAAGLPIVATDVGGVPEAITEGENGLLVPPANSQALAEKIIYLCKHPEILHRMSQTNQIRVEEFFSLDAMIEKTRDVYESK